MKSLRIQNQGRTGQGGFTIIELVVVILLLGILAATALPRFIDVTDEAHNAVVDAVEGGLSTAHALYHAEYVGKGNVGTSVSSYPSVTASSTTGYPDVVTNANCSNAFDNMLQGGHPIVTAGSSIATNVAGIPTQYTTASEGAGLNTTPDFLSYYLTSDQACAYVYLADAASLAAGIGLKVISVSINGDTSRGVTN